MNDNLITENDESIDIDSITDTISSQLKTAVKPKNRKQRRALQKRLGKKGREQQDVITETALKFNYIDLIQKLKNLNEKKENEKNETVED